MVVPLGVGAHRADGLGLLGQLSLPLTPATVADRLARSIGSFFLIWTVAWGLMYACLIPGKGALDKGPVLAVIYIVIVLAASAAVSALQRSWMGEQSPARHRHRRRHGLDDDAERLGRNLAHPETNYSVDGGQCREWHADARQSEKHGSTRLSSCRARTSWLSFPLLFLMGAASHYPMFLR